MKQGTNIKVCGEIKRVGRQNERLGNIEGGDKETPKHVQIRGRR